VSGWSPVTRTPVWSPRSAPPCPGRPGNYAEPTTRPTVTPRSSWPWVRTLLHSIYHPSDAESVVAQYDRVLHALADKLPKVTEHLDASRDELLTFTAFAKQICRQTWPNNPSTRQSAAAPMPWPSSPPPSSVSSAPSWLNNTTNGSKPAATSDSRYSPDPTQTRREPTDPPNSSPPHQPSPPKLQPSKTHAVGRRYGAWMRSSWWASLFDSGPPPLGGASPRSARAGRYRSARRSVAIGRAPVPPGSRAASLSVSARDSPRSVPRCTTGRDASRRADQKASGPRCSRRRWLTNEPRTRGEAGHRSPKLPAEGSREKRTRRPRPWAWPPNRKVLTVVGSPANRRRDGLDILIQHSAAEPNRHENTPYAATWGPPSGRRDRCRLGCEVGR
jgi:Transposase, Mutator family